MTTNLRTARLIAWSAFVLGVSASVAANVAHAKDDLGAQLASAFAPVALFLTVEIMSRVPWPAGPWWNLGRWVGAGTVALVAAVTSYSHMHGLLLHKYGEDPFIAAIQPACVDGLMVVASLALLALGQHTAKPTTDTAAPIPVRAEQTRTTEPTPSPALQDVPEPSRTVLDIVPPLPVELVSAARQAADQHQRDTGRPITRDALRSELRVSNGTAGDLLRLLKDHHTEFVPAVPDGPASSNGRPVPVPERR